MGRYFARIADFQLARGADQHVEHALGDVVLQAQQPQRRAALAGGAERRRDDVVGHLFGQRRGIDDHGVDAAGLGDQRHDRAVLFSERAVDGAAGFGRAGEGDTGDARIGDEARTDRAVAGNEMQRARRHAGIVQQRNGKRGDQRCLLGRLGDDRIAGDQRGGHLAEEYREREIPRADADEDAAAAIAQLVALAGRARQRLWRKRGPRLRGVIAAIIDRLAQLGKRIVQRLAAFALQQRDQPAAVDLEPIGGAFEHSGALIDRRCRPGREPRRSRRHGRNDDGVIGLADDTYRLSVDRRNHETLASRQRDAVDQRRGAIRRADAGANLTEQCVEARAIAELDARRAAPFRQINVARQRDLAVARRLRAGDPALRPAQNIARSARLDRRRPIRTRSWRRSPAAAAPDRRADRDGRRPAHRRGRRLRGSSASKRVVERLAHAVSRWNSKPSTPPASSMTLATVSALWVANCGKSRSRAASSRFTQAM